MPVELLAALWILLMAGIFFCIFILPIILIVKAHKRHEQKRISLSAVVIGHRDETYFEDGRMRHRCLPVVQYDYNGESYQQKANVRGIQVDSKLRYPVNAQVEISLYIDASHEHSVWVEK